jgi:hypothetical protein
MAGDLLAFSMVSDRHRTCSSLGHPPEPIEDDMSRKAAPFFLTAAFTLMLSGAAFARRPPAVAELQDAANGVLAQCPQPTTSGYRDMLARVTVPGSDQSVVHVAARRRMADHSVISCAGETVHTGGGYRDVFVRFQPDTLGPMVALRGRR